MDGATRTLGPGATVDIAVGVAHRIQNDGDVPLVFIEVPPRFGVVQRAPAPTSHAK